MSFIDKIKSFFAGSSTDAHEHDHSGHDHSHEEGSPYLQSPTAPEVVPEPTPAEVAAAAQAEPPTTVVEGLSEDEPKDEVH